MGQKSNYQNNEPKHIFTIDRIPSITLNLVNEGATIILVFLINEYITIISSASQRCNINSSILLIKRSFNRLNLENFKYISFESGNPR